MKKKIFVSCICFILAWGAWAQSGQNVALQTLIANAKKKSSAKTNKLVLPISFTRSKGSPFLAVSLRLEGKNISANEPIEVTLEVAGHPFLLSRSHDFDRNETHIWVSDVLFLDLDFKDTKLIIQGKNIYNLLKKGQLRIFDPEDKTSSTAPQNDTENTCGLPPSVSRSVWGGSLNLRDEVQYRSTPSYTNVTHLIVHHSASANTSANWNATVLSFFDSHVNTNGWSDIGYNYLIAPDGRLFVGRGGGNNVVGAHYCGKNGATMGVCMIGNYMTVAPTDTAWATLEKVLAWKCIESNINPTGIATHSAGNIHQINGHRSGCATDCPGDSSFNRLPNLRGRVATRVAACRATSVRDFAEIGQISLMPNPVIQKKITINANLKNIQPLEIQAFDISGKQVFQKIIAENNLSWSETLDLSNLSNGIYFFYIRVGDFFTTQKIILAPQ